MSADFPTDLRLCSSHSETRSPISTSTASLVSATVSTTISNTSSIISTTAPTISTTSSTRDASSTTISSTSTTIPSTSTRRATTSSAISNENASFNSCGSFCRDSGRYTASSDSTTTTAAAVSAPALETEVPTLPPPKTTTTPRRTSVPDHGSRSYGEVSCNGGGGGGCDGGGGEELVKCVVVGDEMVGKTALVMSYATNDYPQEYQPTTFDRYKVSVEVDEKQITLELCDIAGKSFDELYPLWFTDTHVFLLCFSVVRPATLSSATRRWLSLIRRYRPQAPALLVGTQSDLRSDVQVLIDLSRVKKNPVSSSDGRRAALQSRLAHYIECSALTQAGVKDVFDQCLVAGLVCARAGKQQMHVTSGLRRPTSPNHQRSRWWRHLFCFN